MQMPMKSVMISTPKSWHGKTSSLFMNIDKHNKISLGQMFRYKFKAGLKHQNEISGGVEIPFKSPVNEMNTVQFRLR